MYMIICILLETAVFHKAGMPVWISDNEFVRCLLSVQHFVSIDTQK
jgi:hypothetical protein